MWAELEHLLETRRMIGTSMRCNITDAPRYVHPNGRTYLYKKIPSDVVREGAIVDVCEEMLGWRPEQVKVNKNLVSLPHIDKNKGESAIAFLGTYKGGVLLIREDEGNVTRLEERYLFFYFIKVKERKEE